MFKQGGNGNDTLMMSRATDSSPSGYFEHLQNAAKNADLYKVDVLGHLTAVALAGPLTGNASTASALASTPTTCTLPNVARGVSANGNAVCSQPSNVTGNAATATALAATPTQCTGTNFATGVQANGNANCSTPSASNILTHPTINTGVVNNGSGFQHFRNTGGTCGTNGTVGNTCTTTMNWPASFADTNYDVVCTGILQQNYGTLSVSTKNAGSVVVLVAQVAAGGGASFNEVDCIGVHD